MNKKTIWLMIGAIIIIVVCVVLAGKYLGGSSNNNGQTQPVTTASSTATSTSGNTSSGPSMTLTPTTPTAVAVEFRTSSYVFTYPPSWSEGTWIPGSVNNFNNQFGKGNILPPGGAQIVVATTTVYGNLPSIIAGEMVNARNLTSSTIMIDGVTCDEENFVATYGPGAVAQNVTVYCQRGNELWKIYAAYDAGDPNAASFMKTFSNVFASFQFL